MMKSRAKCGVKNITSVNPAQPHALPIAFAYHFTPSTVYLLPVAATFLSLPLVFRGCSLSRPSSSWQDEPTRPSEEYSHVLHRLFLPLHSSSISLLCSPLDRRAHTPLYCSAPLPPSLSQHPGWCAHAACAQQVRNMQSPSLTARTDSSDQARSQALGKIYLTRLAAIQSQSANWIWSIVYCVRFWTGLFFFFFFFAFIHITSSLPRAIYTRLLTLLHYQHSQQEPPKLNQGQSADQTFRCQNPFIE